MDMEQYDLKEPWAVAWTEIMKHYNLDPDKTLWLCRAATLLSTDDIGRIEDGYHSFDELYMHRTLLFASICNQNPEYAWKSKQHDDPEFPMFEGMFIAGIETPYGQATYHCDLPYWDHFKVKELERAPVFDGHTPGVAISRIYDMFAKREEDEQSV